jgi:RNA polymerase sigma factor (sigma-70 family)
LRQDRQRPVRFEIREHEGSPSRQKPEEAVLSRAQANGVVELRPQRCVAQLFPRQGVEQIDQVSLVAAFHDRDLSAVAAKKEVGGGWDLRPLDAAGTSVRKLADKIAASTAGPRTRAAGEEQVEWVLRALKSLPPRQQKVLQLRYFEGLTVAETAAALGMGASAVKMEAHRALKRLADLRGKSAAKE